MPGNLGSRGIQELSIERGLAISMHMNQGTPTDSEQWLPRRFTETSGFDGVVP